MRSHEARLRRLEDDWEDEVDPAGALMRQVEALLDAGGMSNVLAAGALLRRRGVVPVRDPWDTDGLEETGMGLLLREARAWQRTQEERLC